MTLKVFVFVSFVCLARLNGAYPMDGYPCNPPFEKSGFPAAEENSGLPGYQQVSGEAFGVPNEFVQSGGLSYNYDYMLANQVPNSYQHNTYDTPLHEYRHNPGVMMPNVGIQPFFYQEHQALSPTYPNSVQGAGSSHQAHHLGQGSESHQQHKPGHGENFRQYLLEMQQHEMTQAEDDEGGQHDHGGSPKTDRLAMYDWQNKLGRKTALEIYNIMANEWVKIRGYVGRSTMKRCATSLEVELVKNPAFAYKILARDDHVIKKIYDATRPYFRSDREVELQEPLWQAKDLLNWLQTPIEITFRNSRMRKWAKNHDERDNVVKALCRIWNRTPGTVHSRLNAAHKRNDKLIQSLIPNLLSYNDDEVRTAASFLISPAKALQEQEFIRASGDQLNEYSQAQTDTGTSSQRRSHFSNFHNHSPHREEYEHLQVDQPHLPHDQHQEHHGNYYPQIMQNHWQDQEVHSPELPPLPPSHFDMSRFENWHPLD